LIYFGNPSTEIIRCAMADRDDLGAIITPAQGNRVTNAVTTMIDNGCFTRPNDFTIDRYRDLVADYPASLFATVPDVVGDWDATLNRWLEFPKDGWQVPLAIVLQDGATVSTVPWDEIGAVFVGGSTDWKLGPEAAAIVAEANRQGVWAHMGRVNSLRRLRYAAWIGCDSADGTYLVFGPDINLPRVIRWLEEINNQPLLFPAVVLGTDT
jgi:hypothetical protein